MKFNINLNGKDIEVIAAIGTVSRQPAMSLTRVNPFGVRYDLGGIVFNNDETLTLSINRGDGRSILGENVLLDDEQKTLILANCKKLIDANKPKYVASREEESEWNDDQHGHLMLKKGK